MKRRQFIRGVGAGSAGILSAPAWAAGNKTEDSLPPYDYGKIERLKDVLSNEGLVVVCLTLGHDRAGGDKKLKADIRISGAHLVRSKDYFFESDENFTPSLDMESTTLDGDREVIVLWLDDASEDTILSLGGRKGLHFSLKQLLEAGEISAPLRGSTGKANFLLDREIGEIGLADFGAGDPGPGFSFIVMADPQGGNPEGGDPKNPLFLRTRMKIHNAFIEESVDLANKLDFKPLFCVVAGDVCDDWGYEKDLLKMNEYLGRLKTPVLYGIGNHETELRSKFGPGYNMDAFSNFLAAQKSMNGIDKLLYSFNAGNWHFVIWPDPLRQDFWETHPHYFDWLERDLEKYRDRPTMVFQHVPSQPIGITPHINYAESVYVRRTFLDILARHGNVKYIFSGHVHIPLKASFKTAVSYRGMKLYNLPATGYRPRNFGEEDFYGGPSQGVTMVHVEGERVKVQYKTVTEEVFDFPENPPSFDQESYPLWLSEKWEIPAREQFVNGDFSQGLSNWARRYVYMEDENPSNICEVRPAPKTDGSALYLWCRRRGYQAPGQDRLPQDVNRVTQAVSMKPGRGASVVLSYRIDEKNSIPGGYSGAFFLVEGFRGSNRLLQQMYSAGRIWVNNWGARNVNRDVPLHHFDLDAETGKWHAALLNVASDYERATAGLKFPELGLDRLVLTLGVWNLNDGEEWPFGIYFTGLALDPEDDRSSFVDGKPIPEKPESLIWWRNKTWPNKNIAGEHRYVIATRPEGV